MEQATAKKVLVVGAGSIGQRHMRNLHRLGAEVSVFRYRSALADELKTLPFEVKVVKSLSEGLESGVDAVVVANRTDQHLEVALEAARRGLSLFVEKPLSQRLQGLSELVELEKKKSIVIEVGFCMRFHPALTFIKSFIDSGQMGSVHYARLHVGQYLPDWRPHSDFRQSYSAIPEQGGGVLLDLIHEIDLARWFLGDALDVSAMLEKCPALKIQSESMAQLGLRFASGSLAQIHLDYVRPGYGRGCEIVGSLGVLCWDYLSSELSFAKNGKDTQVIFEVPPTFERNDMFLNQMTIFMERLRGQRRKAGVSLSEAIEAQRIVEAARLSSESRRFVRPQELEV